LKGCKIVVAFGMLGEKIFERTSRRNQFEKGHENFYLHFTTKSCWSHL